MFVKRNKYNPEKITYRGVDYYTDSYVGEEKRRARVSAEAETWEKAVKHFAKQPKQRKSRSFQVIIKDIANTYSEFRLDGFSTVIKRALNKTTVYYDIMTTNNTYHGERVFEGTDATELTMTDILDIIADEWEVRK